MGGKKRAPRKRSNAPKVKIGARIVVKIIGEELEMVLRALDQILLVPLYVNIAVLLRDNRKAVRKYVDEYVALIRPAIVELIGEERAAEGLRGDDPVYPAFLEATDEAREAEHKVRVCTVSLVEIMAERVKLSGAAVDTLIRVGIIIDDRKK